jgi:DNA modification methylase
MNYPASEEGHPCPFSFEIISKMLSIVEFSKGMTVLEPFMGTGRLGREVVKRGGKYIGYEIEKKHFDTAQAKISGLV